MHVPLFLNDNPGIFQRAIVKIILTFKTYLVGMSPDDTVVFSQAPQKYIAHIDLIPSLYHGVFFALWIKNRLFCTLLTNLKNSSKLNGSILQYIQTIRYAAFNLQLCVPNLIFSGSFQRIKRICSELCAHCNAS